MEAASSPSETVPIRWVCTDCGGREFELVQETHTRTPVRITPTEAPPDEVDEDLEWSIEEAGEPTYDDCGRWVVCVRCEQHLVDLWEPKGHGDDVPPIPSPDDFSIAPEPGRSDEIGRGRQLVGATVAA